MKCEEHKRSRLGLKWTITEETAGAKKIQTGRKYGEESQAIGHFTKDCISGQIQPIRTEETEITEHSG